MRWLVIIWVLLLVGCGGRAALTTPGGCPSEAEPEVAQLVADYWLQQTDVWRFRQSVLLEFGGRKVPLEGFLRLDLSVGEARLVAMNEVGLVLFDLEVDRTSEHLHAIAPPLQRVKGLAQGVAASLRRLYFAPGPEHSDFFHHQGDELRLWRWLPGGTLGYIYDCTGQLKVIRQVADAGHWQISYPQYREYGEGTMPAQVIYQDFVHGAKLTIWNREVKKEP